MIDLNLTDFRNRPLIFGLSGSHIFLLLFLDGALLWSYAAALGDLYFGLIDPYFLLQLQFKIGGILVLAWVLASLVANAVRWLVFSLPVWALRRAVTRRFRRFLVSEHRLEYSLGLLFFAFAVNENVLLFLVACGLGSLMALGGIRLSRGRTVLDKRLNRAEENPSKSIALLDRKISQGSVTLGVTKNIFLLAFAVLLGAGFAEKQQNGKLYELDAGEFQRVGPIVGQTSYGFLIWEIECDCLVAVGFSNLVGVSPENENSNDVPN